MKPIPNLRKDLDRFFKYVRVAPETGCWVWTGHRNADGYGRFNTHPKPYQQRSFYAHRWLYIQLIGPIAEGLHLDHWVCNNPACVNPLHLRLMTPTENDVRANNRRWAQRYAHTPPLIGGTEGCPF